VRSDDNIKMLKEEVDCKRVLNQNSSSFWYDLERMINVVEPNILVDFLAGEFPG